MSRHLFAAIVTHHGTAANNRGETDGNVTTLQKLVWQGQVHSTVSAEAIRFALRRRLAFSEPTDGTNRQWNEDVRSNVWKDFEFKGWKKKDGATFIDDDLLGFMSAKAAKEEGEAGSADVRRAVLEVTRAISLLPWSGDVTFNAASPGATPGAAKMGAGNNRIPAQQELLTGIRLVVWIDSSEEMGPSPSLEQRVREALAYPERADRFGGLSFGESTHLVDEVSAFSDDATRQGTAYLLANRGRLTLPVWVDHVGSAGTRFVTGDLTEVSMTAPDAALLPRIELPESLTPLTRARKRSKEQS